MLLARYSALLALPSALAKYASCYPDFGSRDRWTFCTKMAFGLGKYAEVTHLNYFITNYATEESNYDTLELLVLNDDNWSKVHEVGHDNASCEMMKSLAFDSTKIPKESSGEEAAWVNRLIEYKSQVWFFVVADCSLPKDVAGESYQKFGAKV